MISDFTKRQRKILDLILRLSWGCSKKYAIIPHQNDFEITGIHESDIKEELNHLVNCKVIFINNEQYEFNKNFDQWRVTLARKFSAEKLGNLLSLNLNGLGKTPSQNLVKHQETTWQNTKSVTPELHSPKTNINKDKSISSSTVFEIYENNISVLTPIVSKNLKDAEIEYGQDWLKSAIEEAARQNKRSWSYIDAILKNWHSKGYRSRRNDGENKQGTGLPKKYTPAPADPRLDTIA